MKKIIAVLLALYARMMDYVLSQRIISGSKNSKFREAYNLSYTDIYDFASKKQVRSYRK